MHGRFSLMCAGPLLDPSDMVFYDAHLPVVALPTLITFPKAGELKHGTVRPIRGWEIGKPKVQPALIGRVRRVGARPTIRCPDERRFCREDDPQNLSPG